MEIRDFGKLKDGSNASLYILRNSNGLAAAVTDYGATLVKFMVPDRDGDLRDVVLGHDEVSEYETGHGSLGATVGRFANRIGGARFTMNGKTYELTANNGPNALHGGCDPYSKRMWQARIPFGRINTNEIYKQFAIESLNDRWPVNAQNSIDGDTVTFCLDSPDGDQGFPGDLHVEVTYTLTAENELHIDYCAALSGASATPLNLTNHSYFNLSGHDSGTVYDQIVQIRAEQFTPNDKWSLPTGELRDVAGTPMDFRKPKRIGKDILAEDEQIEIGCGYDHNYVLEGWNESPADTLAQKTDPSSDAAKKNAEGLCAYRECASLYSAESGILMTVLTDLPGMQLYTGNHLGGELGKDLASYMSGAGVCFETQFWPDAVNRDNFPGGALNSGEEFHSRTTYRFSIKL